jgi:hypothetical protein
VDNNLSYLYNSNGISCGSYYNNILGIIITQGTGTNCRVLNETQMKRLSNQEGDSLVSILNQNETENTTTLLMTCNSLAVDELGHVYNFSGPYYLDCGEEWV